MLMLLITPVLFSAVSHSVCCEKGLTLTTQYIPKPTWNYNEHAKGLILELTPFF